MGTVSIGSAPDSGGVWRTLAYLRSHGGGGSS